MKMLKLTARNSPVFGILTSIVALLLACSAHAQTSTIWSINATGAEEVGASDPDGSATGTIELNNGTGLNTGFATVNLTLSNVGPVGDAPNYNLGGWHIHQAAAGANGGIVLDFGAATSFLSGNTLSGTINNLSSATINSVFANSANFYFNLHSDGAGPYPGGAVRDQLTTVVPEPSTMALATLGLAALSFRRVRQLISGSRS